MPVTERGDRLSYAEADAVDGVRRDFGVCLLPTDPEGHMGAGGDGSGGAEGPAQPAGGATLVHFNRYLQTDYIQTI